jgi:gamma-glutamyl:cysteine ligase YbdK (ATP-grasp superfamily)
MAYHLFEVFGIELEYMVVEQSSLKVAPIVDQIMIWKNGTLTNDIDNGDIEWSNELVAHVIEIKTNGPAPSLKNLSQSFYENVVEINQILKTRGYQLLPGASHPFMDPKTEMQLWKHSYSEVYALYNRIFDCRGHGWSNVQSMHINLPFFDDFEFEKLHAAIRILLPILPALSASSPIFEGQRTGFLDSRLEVYKTNQKEIPAMTGKVIPEAVFSKELYNQKIFAPINEAIRPFDTENILDHHFLNSRGAIARFDRNAIEIRVLDLQECPKADLAIAALIVAVLKSLVDEAWATLEEQKYFSEQELFDILDPIIKKGENTLIQNLDYLRLFNRKQETTAGDLWRILFRTVSNDIPSEFHEALQVILEEGTLSTRILKALGPTDDKKRIMEVYTTLGECLAKNELFRP